MAVGAAVTEQALLWVCVCVWHGALPYSTGWSKNHECQWPAHGATSSISQPSTVPNPALNLPPTTPAAMAPSPMRSWW